MEVSADDGQYLAQAKWDTPRVVKGVRFSLRLNRGSSEDSRLVTTAITADTAHRFSGLPLGDHPDGAGDKQLWPAGGTRHHLIPD